MTFDATNNGTATINGNINLNTTGTTGITRTFTINDGAATIDASIAGIISNTTATGLTKAGAGTLALSGANTYTGATTISAGTLSVSSLANGGLASNIGQSTNAAANLVFDGGTLQYTGGSVSTDRNFTINTGKTATIDVSTAATNLTISGASTATNGALTKIGAGTLILSGANAYSGATNINAGTLSLDSAGSTTARLTSTSTINVNSGGTLLLANSSGTTSTDRIGNSVPVTLNGGGTINTGGLSEGTPPTNSSSTNGAAGMGALTLQSTSSSSRATIDFLTGANGSTLAFNSVSGLANVFLDIKNWTGTPFTDNSATGNDRLLFANDPGSFTAAQLANIRFFDDSGAFIGAAEIIGYGNMFELIAVPEPSTWVAGALALTSLVLGQRRRISRRRNHRT